MKLVNIAIAFALTGWGVIGVAAAGEPAAEPAPDEFSTADFVDYSESGQALRFARRGPREFDVFVTPGLEDDALDFAVRNRAPSQELVLHVHGAPPDAEPSYSYGQYRWHPLESVAEANQVITLRARFTAQHVVIRLRPLGGSGPDRGRPYYNLARLESFLATLAGDPYVTVETIGWSYLNRPYVDRPIYKVTVKDPAVPDENKLAVLITNRVHGNEPTCSYITEGMIEYARGKLAMPPPYERPDDLLDRMVFIIYIMLNPDGVETGSSGSRYNRNGKDLNRNWDHTGSGPSEEWEIRHVHGDIEKLMAGHFFAQAVDMHGWWSSPDGGYRFGLGMPPGNVPGNYYENQQTFFEMQEEVNPWRLATSFTKNGATVGMARYCLFKQFNIDAHTSESNEYSSRTVKSVTEEGANYLLSFYYYLLNAHFTDAAGTDVSTYRIDKDDAYVTVYDYDEDRNGGQIEEVTVTITNSANADTERVQLSETGLATGIFRNPTGLSVSSEPYDPQKNNDGTIQTAPGATLTVTYTDSNFTQSTTRDTALVTSALGDMNCDGEVNFDDIDPFVLALSDPPGYKQAYPNCDIINGDINGDGLVNFDDIDPFVALLGG